MDEVRNAINKMLLAMCNQYVSEADWVTIKAAIDKAHPNRDTISVALHELDKARPADRWHCITLYGDQSGGVYTRGTEEEGRKKIKHFSRREGIVPAIRDLIPPPEPTLEKDLETIREVVSSAYQSGQSHGTAAMAALDRTRKRLDELDWTI